MPVCLLQGLVRPDFDHRDRDWKCLSLNDETKTETENVFVSMTRRRLKMPESQWRDRDWKDVSLNGEMETENVWVSMTRPRRRLKNLSLNDETETEKIRVSMTGLGKRCQYRDCIETLTVLSHLKLIKFG